MPENKDELQKLIGHVRGCRGQLERDSLAASKSIVTVIDFTH